MCETWRVRVRETGRALVRLGGEHVAVQVLSLVEALCCDEEVRELLPCGQRVRVIFADLALPRGIRRPQYILRLGELARLAQHRGEVLGRREWVLVVAAERTHLARVRVARERERLVDAPRAPQ